MITWAWYPASIPRLSSCSAAPTILFFARDVFAIHFIIPDGMAAPFQGRKVEGKKINWLPITGGFCNPVGLC
jgi:hypothetical protein